MSDLIEELEMWAKHDPTDTSVPFGKVFTRAANAIKFLDASLEDRIKGETLARQDVIKIRDEVKEKDALIDILKTSNDALHDELNEYRNKYLMLKHKKLLCETTLKEQTDE